MLVTGAGGSIGSELCRQIARVGPAKLVLVDHAEPALFEIERELVRERRFLAAAAVVGDVRDPDKLRQVFDKYRPGVVFHAAAYKHVALMEANPLEAVRNNTLGTRVVADVAVEYGTKRFVLVSTDKAANPRTVMGQSKALAEWIVETWGHRADVSTRFVAVRFGNVLGSSGSVVPIFRRQIARGGPVTVTHPEMTRFFMTIPEAVQLVVQAGAIGGRGQVYVLDMGEPVRIVDLAENMIRLSGKSPGTDDRDRVHRARAGREAPRGARRGRRDGDTQRASEDRSDHETPRRRRLARGGALAARAARGGRRHARARRRAATARDRAAARHGRGRSRATSRSPMAGPVFAVGDVHGHRDVLVGLLRDAGLLDAAESWAGADARLWLVGDLVDRGPDGIGAIELVRRLERESAGRRALPPRESRDDDPRRRTGSATRRRASPGRAFRDIWKLNGGVDADLAALTPEHVAWMTALPPLAREGDWLVVHADTTAYLELGSSIDAVARATATMLAVGDAASVDELLGIVSDRMRLGDPEAVDALLDAYGGSRIVHGHTPIASVLHAEPGDVTAPLRYGDDGRVTEHRPLPLRRRPRVRGRARRWARPGGLTHLARFARRPGCGAARAARRSASS